MSIESAGWHRDARPPSWDAEAKAFSFFLRKAAREPVLCILATDGRRRHPRTAGAYDGSRIDVALTGGTHPSSNASAREQPVNPAQ